MKRIILKSLLAFAALALSACMQDKFHSGTTGEEVEFTISASLSDEAATYLSDQGGVSNVSDQEFRQRYILEVWTDEQQPRLAYRTVKQVPIGSPASFTARLAAMEYTFAFWADFVPAESNGEDYVYDTNADDATVGLRGVTYKDQTRASGNEYADAYAAIKSVNMMEQNPSLGNVILKRPLAKVRLVSIDEKYSNSNALDIYPKTITVNYGTTKIADTYDVLTGIASGQKEAGSYEFTTYEETPVTVDGQMYPGQGESYRVYILGIDYMFVSDEYSSLEMDVEMTSNLDKNLGMRSISTVPVKDNMLTTVIGSYYTNEGTIDVSIDESFENGEKVIFVASGATDMQDIINGQLPESGDVQINVTGAVAGAVTIPSSITNNITIIFNGLNNEFTINAADYSGMLTLVNIGTDTEDGILNLNIREDGFEIKSGKFNRIVLNGEDYNPEVPDIQTVTISEFLAKEVSDQTWYQLTGKITEISNSTYGNFTIEDESASVYVYGLTAAKSDYNDKSFASLGLEAGDILTLVGTRDEFKGDAQVGGPAYYISHEDGEPAEDVMTISEVIAAEKGAQVMIQETVYATYARGFLVGNGTEYMLVYENDAPSASVGDKVEVNGIKDIYGGLSQIKSPQVTILSSGNEVTLPEPEVIDGTAADAFLGNPECRYITYKGTLSISGNYYNVAIEGASTAIGSIAYPEESLGLSSLDGKSVSVTGFYVGTTGTPGKYINTMAVEVKEDDGTEPDPDPDTMTIAEVIASSDDTAVKVEEVVYAIYNNGFIVGDGTDYMLIYQGFGASVPAIGDRVKVTGTKDTFGGMAQIASPVVEVISGGNSVSYPEPRILDGTAADAQLSAVKCEYIRYTGNLNVSGKYYNVTIDGAKTAVGSIAYPSDELGIDALDKRNVTVTGFFIGTSGDRYISTMAVEVKDEGGVVIPDPEEGAIEFVLGDNAYNEHGTVNGESKSFLKLGSNKNNGNATFSVPAGTTRIELYAVTWNNKESATLTLSGDCTIDPESVQIRPNAGAANSSPYTIEATNEDKYVFNLSGVDTETTITITADARAIIWDAISIK